MADIQGVLDQLNQMPPPRGGGGGGHGRGAYFPPYRSRAPVQAVYGGSPSLTSSAIPASQATLVAQASQVPRELAGWTWPMQHVLEQGIARGDPHHQIAADLAARFGGTFTASAVRHQAALTSQRRRGRAS